MIDFLNPPPVLSILRFLEKWSYDISRDLLTPNFYFEMLTTISSFVCQILIPSSYSAPKLQPINHFPLVNPLDPGFKLFKAGNHFHLETPTQKIVQLLTTTITFPLFYNKEGKDSLKSFAPSVIRSGIPCPAYSEHLLLEVVGYRKAA